MFTLLERRRPVSKDVVLLGSRFLEISSRWVFNFYD